MKTSIIILAYDKLDYTKLCIESIRKYTNPGEYEIIVAGEKPNIDTKSWFKEQNDIVTIFNEDNMKFSRVINDGIKIASGDNILLLDNDTVVTPRWLDNLTTCLYNLKKNGAVGAVTNSGPYYQVIDAACKNVDEAADFAEQYNRSNPDLWEEKLRLNGFCLLIKKEVIDKVGLLDERFTPGICEADDYSFRIRIAGYSLVLCKDTFIYHFNTNIFNYQLIVENEKKFEEKWKFNLRYSTGVRQEIINLIDTPKDKKINVLEIGCACGGTLLKIRDIYKNADIYGIELNIGAAQIAQSFAEIKKGDIENEPLDYPDNFFDYIIFADVLEHLNNPWVVLTNIKKCIKPEGCVLASIPNIMHYSVLRGLINGYWTYEEAGILDRTHLRFFTLNEIDKMFKDTGYQILACFWTLLYKTAADENFISQLNELTGKNLTSQYEAYQYIIKAKNIAGVEDTLSKALTETNIKEDKNANRDLKFLLRRIENGVKTQESMEKVIELINNKKYMDDIVAVIMNDIIEREKIISLVWLECCKYGLFDNAMELRKKYHAY
ncbi:ubiquinone biosynthesis O-methyltransferase [Oxobacter pfennigii]|uniref:Ubiquinone biosynthesis O-methyltransferase n=1 Tax=Oxobacter pfennigii TaxID=36849 RepID=A0A0P8WLS2_9CLOT|nr:methyltransferase domain-containing protein [Oxobacter pfennigii]KPU43418.1 ubiquinone biosynthesis O-methyltransferase [Oxobacter pfennigii]